MSTGGDGAARPRMDLVRVENPAPPPPPPSSTLRDAATVFPARTASTMTKAVGSALAAAGALAFVSEADLARDRAATGGTTTGPDPSKPLVEVLRAAKAAKQEAFDDAWKQMKIGGNRPLEADEASFLADLADAKAAADAAVAAAEKAEVAAFQAEAARLAEERAAKAKKAAAREEGGGVVVAAAAAVQPAAAAPRPRLAARVVVKKAAGGKRKARSPTPPLEPEDDAAAADAGGGLAGLLGGYGSGGESSE